MLKDYITNISKNQVFFSVLQSIESTVVNDGLHFSQKNMMKTKIINNIFSLIIHIPCIKVKNTAIYTPAEHL